MVTAPVAGDDSDVERLQRCIRELRELDRAVILLYLERLPHEEIAELTGITRKNVGVRVVRRKGKRPIGYVVVGMDRKFTYRKLWEAQQAIRGGAQFIATNRDATYPVEDNVIPGGGSVEAAVATAAETEPILIGKPSPRAGQLITQHAGVRPSEVLMVGDRLETDIEMGRRAGLWTCLVLTGISTAEEAAALPPESRPHSILPSIAQLPGLLREGGFREEGLT